MNDLQTVLSRFPWKHLIKKTYLNLKGNFSSCEIQNTQLTKEIISELPLIAINFSLLSDPNLIIVEQSRVRKSKKMDLILSPTISQSLVKNIYLP